MLITLKWEGAKVLWDFIRSSYARYPRKENDKKDSIPTRLEAGGKGHPTTHTKHRAM